MEFDFDLDRIVDKINKEKPKLVCIQLSDGLKPRALEIPFYMLLSPIPKFINQLRFVSGSI